MSDSVTPALLFIFTCFYSCQVLLVTNSNINKRNAHVHYLLLKLDLSSKDERKSWFSIHKPGFMVPVTGMPVRGQSLDHCIIMPVAGQALCCHMLPAADIKDAVCCRCNCV